jgi:NAD(P)H dehydrogenase (quinone)
MAVTGPDFISLQARDLELSAAFSGQYLGEAMAGFLVSLDEPIAAGMFAKADDDLTRVTARRTTMPADGLTGR